tara:strand:- start:4648 stop:5664 length:1017 start_codon:yes stop_codon:yes gene_type:complete
MGKNIVNVSLFGLGRIGQMHAKNLISHPKFKLISVYDINYKLSKKLSKKFNCSNLENPNLAMLDKKIDVIFIATSTSTHLKFITEAVKNKKIVFCEKPLDLSLEKIEKCRKKIKKYNPKIQIGFNRRYDPGHNLLKKNLMKGKIGNLEKIIITSRDPAPPSIKYLKTSGGIFKDMMIHDFDLARYYVGKDEFDSIFATASNLYDKKFNKVKDFELASCVLKTKKGIQCIITNSRHCSFGYDQRIELFGTKGMLISGNKRETETKIFSNKSTNVESNLLNFFIERYSEAYKIQLDDLFMMSRKNIAPLASFEDGRKSLVLAQKAMDSVKSKKFEKIKLT